jgi:hypothetical protein
MEDTSEATMQAMKITIAIAVDPSVFVVTCCVIALIWAFIQFVIIQQTK